jgi:preprotein translocase subunit SecD
VLLIVHCVQAADTVTVIDNEVKAEKSEGLTFRILASRAYPQDEDIIRRGESEPGRVIRDQDGKIIARWVPIVDSQKSSFEHPNMVLREREGTLEALVKYDDGVDMTGEYLTRVARGTGRDESPMITFNFNAVGVNKFGRLTHANRPDPAQPRLVRHLGIIINGYLYSAPVIRSTIWDSGILVSLEFRPGRTEAEQQRLSQEIDSMIEMYRTRHLRTGEER